MKERNGAKKREIREKKMRYRKIKQRTDDRAIVTEKHNRKTKGKTATKERKHK